MKNKISDKHKQILRGSLDNLPQQPSKIISIFLSSTFKDFYEERDYLMEYVYPNLKHYCKHEYNLEFQIVDMRWGIQSSGKKLNTSSEFCFNEIKTCYDISAKPSFIALLGHRFGAPYLPIEIGVDEYKHLKSEISQDKLKFEYINEENIFNVDDIMERCYKCDLNVEPNVYRLVDMENIITESTYNKKVNLKEILLRYDGKCPYDDFNILSQIYDDNNIEILNDREEQWRKDNLSEERINELRSDFEYHGSVLTSFLYALEGNIKNYEKCSKEERIFLCLVEMIWQYFGNPEREDLYPYSFYGMSKENQKREAKKQLDSLYKGPENLSVRISEWILDVYENIDNKPSVFHFCYFIEKLNREKQSDMQSDMANFFDDVKKAYELEIFKKTKYEKNLWRKIEEKLIDLFKNSSEKCLEKKLITTDAYYKYYTSITEQEMSKGIMERDDASECSLVFIREIEDIKDYINDNKKLMSHFIEMQDNGEINQIKQSHIDNFNKELIDKCKKLNVGVFENKLQWNKVSGVNRKEEQQAKYFLKFGSDFENGVKKLIKNYQDKIKQFNDVTEIKEVFEEVIFHANFALGLVKRMQEKEEFVKKIIESINNNESKEALVLHGDSGCGKSSIIAKVALQLFEKMPQIHEQKYSIMLRFLGTTPLTSTIENTLKSIISQLDLIYPLKDKTKSNEDYKEYDSIKMSNILVERIKQIEKEYPDDKLIFLIDSIDQLNIYDHNLEWLISKVDSNNAAIVYTTLSDYNNILEKLETKITNKNNFIPVDVLDQNSAVNILKGMLSRQEKKNILRKEQSEAIETLFKDENTQLYPLYVKLIFDIVSDWHSYTKIPQEFNSLFNIDSCIEYIFKLIEEDYGKLLVSRCLFYLTSCEESGVSDVELEDVLSLDDELLSVVFKKQDSPIFRFPITLWNRIKYRLREYITVKQVDNTQVNCWYHRRFIEVARIRYIESLDSKTKDILNLNLLDVFNEVWSVKPKPFEASSNSKVSDETTHKKRLTSPQPLRLSNKELNKRKINKILETAIKVENMITRSKILVEQIFLNYEFLFACFEKGYFNVVDYCLNVDYISDLLEFMYDDDKERSDDDKYVLISAFIQYIVISNSDCFNKYPKSIGTQLCSRLLAIYGICDTVTKFIDDCDFCSVEKSGLIPAVQILPLSTGRTRVVHNFFNQIDGYQDLGTSGQLKKHFYLYGNTIGYFHWNTESNGRSELKKEIKLPNTPKFNILKVFEYPEGDSYGIIVANEEKILFLKDTGEVNPEYLRNREQTEKIKDIILIGNKGFIVYYDNKNYFDIFNTHTYRCIERKRDFNGVITHLTTNEATFWGAGIYGYSKDYFLSLFINNSELYIYEIISDFWSQEFQNASIKLNVIYKYAFIDYKLVSGSFQLYSNQIVFFATSNTEKCLLIKDPYNDRKRFTFNLVELDGLNAKELKIVTFYNEIVVLTDQKNTYLYDTKKMKWLSIPGTYKGLFCDMFNKPTRIYAFSSHYIDEYFIDNTKNENHYTSIHLIQKYRFTDENYYIIFAGSIVEVMLKNGCLIEISTDSMLFAKRHDNISASVGAVSNLIELNQSNIVSYSEVTRELNEWQLDNAKLSFNPIQCTLFDVKDIVLHKNSIIVIGENEKNYMVKAFEKISGIENYVEKKDFIFEKLNKLLVKVNLFKDILNILSVFNDYRLQIKQINVDSKTKEWVEECTIEINLEAYITVKEAASNIVNQKCFNIKMTDLNGYLGVIVATQLIYVNISEKVLLASENFQERLSGAVLYSVSNSDNIVLYDNQKSLLYFVCYNGNQSISLVKEPCKNIGKVNVRGQTVAFAYLNSENGNEEVKIYNLNSKNNSFDLLFTISQFDSNKIELLVISSDFNYLATYDSSKALSLFRTKDGNRISHIPILGNPSCMIVTTKYVVLAVEDTGLMPFLIVDSNESKKRISALDSRKKARKVTSKDLDLVFNTLIQLFDDRFVWDTIFNENTNEIEDTQKESAFKEYTYDIDVFKCLINYIRDKKGTNSLLEEYHKAIEDIRLKAEEKQYKESTVKTIQLNSQHQSMNNEDLRSEKSSTSCVIS